MQSEIDSLAKIRNQVQKRDSYIGVIGKFIEPVIKPLGFTWEMGVSIVSGMFAKEVVVSTLNVLYTGEEGEDVSALSTKLSSVKTSSGEHVYTPLIALSFMIFVLIYFPCMATLIAIKNESGSWLWAATSMLYTCSIAWFLSFCAFQIGKLF